MLKYFILSIGICLLFACGSEQTAVPRQMAFHRIDFPKETTYKVFDNYSCPFTFEYPDYGEVTRDFRDSCWVDINFGPYDCKWHLTYRGVKETGKTRSLHFEDHRKIVYKHVKKLHESKIVLYR